MTSSPKFRQIISDAKQSHDLVMTESCKIRIDKNRIDKNIFIPPTLEQVKSYIIDKNYTVDPEWFINHYKSKDWMIGKNKMSCWKSALATCQRNEIKWNKQKEIDKHPGIDYPEL